MAHRHREVSRIEGFSDTVFGFAHAQIDIATDNVSGFIHLGLAAIDFSGGNERLRFCACIGEAAFHMASLIAAKFSVVTTLSRSIAPIEHNLMKYGLATRCARVRACDVPVLALENPGSDARRRIEAEIKRALAEDGAEAIVLGCAGMTDLADDLAKQAGVPVLDGVACAVSLAESLVRIRLKTSKRNSYAPPLVKLYAGEFKRFAPR